MDEGMKEKFEGALIGCAVGDALGAPFEGRLDSELWDLDDLVSDFRKVPGWPKGQYTDDTQLTLALAETYVEKKKFHGEDFGRRVAKLWESREIVGAGGACTCAALNLISGLDWRKAGAPPGQAGNGAAMRASPAGLFRHKDLEKLRQESVDHSRVTHQDARAGAGAAAVAFAVAWNLNGRDPDPRDFCREVSDFVRPVYDEFADFLARLPEWLAMDEDEAVMEMACAGWIDPPRRLGVITPFVMSTVLASFWAFLQHPDDYAAAVCRVMKLGGDVDTTGAITGAISGSRAGIKGIPENLAYGVLDSERIRRIAGQLYRAARR